MEPFTIRYAEKTDEEIVRIHHFVALVAGPVLFVPIDPVKSVNEISRVVRDQTYGFALVAEIKGEIVGSIGLVAPDFWYGNGTFFTDRWFFTYPALHHHGIGVALEAYARATIPEEIPLIINGKLKKFNAAGGGVHFQRHRLIAPAPEPSKH